MPEGWCYSTFAQFAFCVRVSGGRLSDIGAVWLLRQGLWLVIIGLSCSMVSARVSLVGSTERLHVTYILLIRVKSKVVSV